MSSSCSLLPDEASPGNRLAEKLLMALIASLIRLVTLYTAGRSGATDRPPCGLTASRGDLSMVTAVEASELYQRLVATNRVDARV